MRIGVVILGLATAAVVWGSWQAQQGLRAWALARAEWQQWQQRSNQLQADSSAWQQRAQQFAALEQLQQRLRDTGLGDAAWMQRHLRRADGPASRTEALTLLAEIGPSVPQRAVFVPEQFDLRVASAADGLFQIPTAQDQGVQLAYAGQWWWRLSDASVAGSTAAPGTSVARPAGVAP